MIALVHRFLRNRSGATAIEYSILAVGVAVAVVVAVQSIGGTTKQGLQSVETGLQ